MPKNEPHLMNYAVIICYSVYALLKLKNQQMEVTLDCYMFIYTEREQIHYINMTIAELLSH